MENSGWVDDVVWLPANGPDSHVINITIPGSIKPFSIGFQFGYVDGHDMFHQLFYGNQWKHPNEMMGLSSLYCTMDHTEAQNASCVRDGGSRGGSLTSIWVLGFGEESIFMATPDGPPPNGPTNAVIVVKDYRYVARIANVDPLMPKDEIRNHVLCALVTMPKRIYSDDIRAVIYMCPELYKTLDMKEFRGISVREVPLSTAEECVPVKKRLAS